ncbi:MAG: LacI family DNA-binding transcriptional regulator [Chloroflexi bacterium]|nr:LacI family DNA-binding transcriptional regulator [Chloroflexota bacterium]
MHEKGAGVAGHTLNDVAVRAGVSKATASRVLNGKSAVDPHTRDRVLAAMSDLDYTPSTLARRLSFGRTLTISVVTTFLTRPQAAERLRGVDAVLSDSEFDLVIYNVETIDKRDQYLRGLALAQRTDGLLVISLPLRERDAQRLSSAAIPVVVVDAHAPAVEGLPHVVGDDIRGGEAATRHLLGLGHRRIAFLGDQFDDPFGFTSSRHRAIGYERAMRAAGVDVRPGHIALGAHSRYEARELAGRLLALDDRPTAVFAASDTQALGVISAAHEAGLRVPDDLSVIGYDDIEMADYLELTTVRQQMFESGRLGAELLLREIDRRSEDPPSVVLDPEVVIRGTTAPPKEGRRSD